MTATIYYFSGTGNSLKIARDLAAELDQAEVVFIPDVLERDEIRTESEVVGIIFPVYMFGTPLAVLEFIGKLVVRKGSYVFVVTNYGGMGGGAISLAEESLKKQGIALSSAFGMKMPSNYTPFGGAEPDEKQKLLFDREKDKVKEIAGIVRRRGQGPFEKPFFITDRSGVMLFKLLKGTIHSMDKEFWVNDDCVSCGICQKVCPADNITLTESGRPRWMGKCQQCLACLQWCPKEAIQCGRNTKGKKRYHQPEAKLSDFMRKR